MKLGGGGLMAEARGAIGRLVIYMIYLFVLPLSVHEKQISEKIIIKKKATLTYQHMPGTARSTQEI